jgi:magnesium chelatase family protein
LRARKECDRTAEPNSSAPVLPREVPGLLAKLNTFALVGIDAVPVEAEVDAAPGLPKTALVGLPEVAVRESVHRIERALVNLGYNRHPGRTVISWARRPSPAPSARPPSRPALFWSR